jgi:hypothetical protein
MVAMRANGFDRMVLQTPKACGGDGFACTLAGAMLGHERRADLCH